VSGGILKTWLSLNHCTRFIDLGSIVSPNAFGHGATVRAREVNLGCEGNGKEEERPKRLKDDD